MTPSDPSPDVLWPSAWPESPVFDGGETGCGELLLDLLLFTRKQPASTIVRLRALDPGAPHEIPAWCRLTGCQLKDAQWPYFLIETPPA